MSETHGVFCPFNKGDCYRTKCESGCAAQAQVVYAERFGRALISHCLAQGYEHFPNAENEDRTDWGKPTHGSCMECHAECETGGWRAIVHTPDCPVRTAIELYGFGDEEFAKDTSTISPAVQPRKEAPMASITPTPGRIVWFHPSPNTGESGFTPPQGDRPCAAIVAYVHSDTMVNLTVFDANGVPHSRTSVPLHQEGNERPQGYYCEWMPYQKGQAAKTEALEKQVAGA